MMQEILPSFQDLVNTTESLLVFFFLVLYLCFTLVGKCMYITWKKIKMLLSGVTCTFNSTSFFLIIFHVVLKGKCIQYFFFISIQHRLFGSAVFGIVIIYLVDSISRTKRRYMYIWSPLPFCSWNCTITNTC